MGTDHVHQAATFDEAERAIRAHDVVWVNDCFCRAPAKEGEAGWKWCGHLVETCMGLHPPEGDEPGYEARRIDQAEALAIHENWKTGGGFFRFMEDQEWICCCCACGCMWFRDEEGNRVEDRCLKSGFIESTDLGACTVFGECIDVCAFEARAVEDEEMVVTARRCYGCSACVPACPEEAISMVARGESA